MSRILTSGDDDGAHSVCVGGVCGGSFEVIQFAFLVRLERVWGAQEDSQGEIYQKIPEIAKRVVYLICILGGFKKKCQCLFLSRFGNVWSWGFQGLISFL